MTEGEEGKKKIAIVYHFFAHYRGPIIEEMLNCKVNSYYFLAGDRVNSSYRNLKLYEFDTEDRFIRLKNIWFFKNFLWQPNLFKMLKQEKFDGVIFLGDWKFLSTWISIFLLRLNNTPTYFWSHGVRSRRRSLNNKLKLIFLKCFSHGGVVYDKLAKEIMKSSGFKKPICVIYNSLNYKMQERILNNLNIGELKSPFYMEVNYVVFTGRLEQRKRLDILIDAISLLKNKGLFVGALIIGDGDLKLKLIKRTEELAINDRVIFLGSCYDENSLANYFIKSIACIIPDAVGLTAIHSLTYGTPIITNDSMGLHGPEIECVQDGVSGFFYKNDDPASLAERIEYLMLLPKEKRKIIGENGRRIISEHYNPEKQLAVMNNLLLKHK
ncbi:glycosyltransferase [Pedobacter sp. Du54]|uniref:glycosyltransferase family 4 protein n=1 Tax=Pedobacter anseongensis TaxID=3133439 RepID=UPI0030A2CA7E